MSVPTLTPASVLSAIVLPITGTLSHADTNNTNEVFVSLHQRLTNTHKVTKTHVLYICILQFIISCQSQT